MLLSFCVVIILSVFKYKGILGTKTIHSGVWYHGWSL